MTYFDPTPPQPEHRCPLPTGWNIHNGWRCGCGKAYTRESLPARDVNPGEIPWQWRRAPEYDST